MAGWKEIVGLVMALAAKEPPFMQIVLGLGAAFCLLMFFEGVRANFVPRRRTRTAPLPVPSPRPAARAKKAAAAPVPRFVLRAVPPANPKRRVAAIKPHSAPRPTIRRRPMVMAAARTDLPQVGSFDE